MIVGLTGGIGSGKSTVAKLFELLGCKLFISDEVAKQLYFNPKIKTKVIALIGSNAYLNATTLNKPFINSKLFNNKLILEELNIIIHPAVASCFNDFILKNKNQIIINETALLFEANLQNQVNKIILVVANDELRIKRTMQRDNLSEEDVVKKINNQLPQNQKIKQSHFVIYNNETQLVITQVLEIYKQLMLL